MIGYPISLPIIRTYLRNADAKKEFSKRTTMLYADKNGTVSKKGDNGCEGDQTC